MPCIKDEKTGKWKVGNGKPIYKTREDCEKAQRAYHAKQNK